MITEFLAVMPPISLEGISSDVAEEEKNLEGCTNEE